MVVIMRLSTYTGPNMVVVILNSGVVLVLKLKCMYRNGENIGTDRRRSQF